MDRGTREEIREKQTERDDSSSGLSALHMLNLTRVFWIPSCLATCLSCLSHLNVFTLWIRCVHRWLGNKKEPLEGRARGSVEAAENMESGSGPRAWRRISETHYDLKMGKWDPHRVFTVSKPGSYRIRDVFLGPSLQCFLLPSYHPPVGLEYQWH
jgi:hypothetical protein